VNGPVLFGSVLCQILAISLGFSPREVKAAAIKSLTEIIEEETGKGGDISHEDDVLTVAQKLLEAGARRIEFGGGDAVGYTVYGQVREYVVSAREQTRHCLTAAEAIAFLRKRWQWQKEERERNDHPPT